MEKYSYLRAENKTSSLFRFDMSLLHSKKKLVIFLFACLFAVAGCAADEHSLQSPFEVNIFAGERSDALNEAKVSIIRPQDNEKLKPDKVSLVLRAEGVELGAQTQPSQIGEIANSVKGQHMRVIVNNESLADAYEAGQITLGRFSPGVYTAFSFPVRSYYESFKNEGASDLVNFCVVNNEGSCIERDYDVYDHTKAIFYNRPEGEYRGASAKKIMLDFYLHNMELSEDGYNARYTVTKKNKDGQSHSIVLKEWKPAFITGLQSGLYIVKLDLIDNSGRIVGPNEVAYSETSREIRVFAE